MRHVFAALLALLALPALLLSGVVASGTARAQTPEVRTTFVHLGNGVPGAFYEPATPGPKAAIAVFVMHSGADYLDHSACTELPLRGYSVLCANNTTGKSGLTSDFDIERAVLDAKLGVAWLRNRPGIRKVVLLGHSGGGTVMTSYQNAAENGLRACQGPEKIVKCSGRLAGLPAADGLMLLDSNYGIAAMMIFSLDPAVTDESTGYKLDPKLDLFNPQNGFNAAGSGFSAAFVRRFQSAVGARNNRLIAAAQSRMAAIAAGKGRFNDDEPMIIVGGNFLGSSNRLFAQDTKLLSHTRNAWPLLKKDGTAVTQIVHSVRVPENNSSLTASLERGALTTSTQRFLSSFALRTGADFSYDEDSIRGMDWTSSFSSPEGNVQGITVPLLTLGMTGHWEYLASEIIYENAKSVDKTLAFVEGATHVFTTCTKCEKVPGEFGDTQKTTYDYVDGWLSKPGRF
jgi:pimeloyl-ACP methyl ester carboxylesterase